MPGWDSTATIPLLHFLRLRSTSWQRVTRADMKSELASVSIDGREIVYRIRQTRSSGGPRIRVGTSGVEVLAPLDGSDTDPTQFLLDHSEWVVRQLERVDRLEAARRPRC